MSHPPAVILSPHLDDAVLSCWHVLCGPGDVRVINVFAGSPPPGSGASWWDQQTGATDSAARMEERRAEDAEAIAVAGRSAIHLDFLDQQYEPAGQSVGGIVARLRDLIDADVVVYAPAALGDHADHERVRRAAVELAASGQRVRLYADHPHAVRRGWPAWINGTDTASAREAAAQWERRLREVGLTRARPTLHHLDDAERERKLKAVSAYRTQVPGLGADFGELDGFPAFPLEIVWTLS
ncbi:PIG-L deacetylase family protein [Nocardioides stalactiti]|uniref:PIG-L deacetylase family protein n=1 Tax=Nocardioides stalactiti TaxID=2755356 RepID=UPI00160007AF|nr:PIG-L family deacetylase [Nocardioides stalactiti]